jgi:hypothetical protein
MRYRVWNKKNLTTHKDGDVYFRLKTMKDSFMLICVDENGKMIDDGQVLAVDDQVEGIILFDNVPPEVGLKTDLTCTPVTITYADYKRLEYEHNQRTHTIMLGGCKHDPVRDTKTQI